MDTDRIDTRIAQEQQALDTVVESDNEKKGSFTRLLRSANFRRLWIAQFISGIGDWLIIGLLIPTVMALSGGKASAVAGIMIAKIVPALFLSSFTGVIVDHFDRRKVMVVADIVRLFLVLILLTTNSLAAIYLVVLLMETASLFFWPARNALIPAMVREEDVSLANGFMYTTQQCSMVVGLAASGAILAGFERIVKVLLSVGIPGGLVGFRTWITPILVGSRAGYLLDSLTFVFSTLLILGMRHLDARPAHADHPLDAGSMGKGVKEQFSFMKDHDELRGLLITVFFAIVGGGALVTVGLDYISTLGGTIPFADRSAWIAKFSGSRQTFILVFLAVGMVVGALSIPRLEKRIPVRILFPVSVTIFGAGLFGFATTNSYFVACLYAGGAGLCIAALYVAGNNYIVAEVADELRGRVFTLLESVIRVSLLVSMVIFSPISDIISTVIVKSLRREGVTVLAGQAVNGARMTLFVSGIIVLAAAAYGWKKMYFDKRGIAPVQHDEKDGNA